MLIEMQDEIDEPGDDFHGCLRCGSQQTKRLNWELNWHATGRFRAKITSGLTQRARAALV
jgi:hypothetical protein